MAKDEKTICSFTKEGQSRSLSRRHLIRLDGGKEESTKALKQELSLCIKEKQNRCGWCRVMTKEKYRDEIKGPGGMTLYRNL